MNINLKSRRRVKRFLDLRWAAALALAAMTVSGTTAAAADTPDHEPGVAFANGEEQDQERADAEQRAELMRRAQASDRHLQTLADAAQQRAMDAHIEHEADARAEAAADAAADAAELREWELQAHGSDQHLETLADAAEAQAREQQAQGSDQHLENLATAGESSSRE